MITDERAVHSAAMRVRQKYPVNIEHDDDYHSRAMRTLSTQLIQQISFCATFAFMYVWVCRCEDKSLKIE